MKSLIGHLFILFSLSSCSVLSLLNSGTAHLKYTVAKAKFNDITYENKNRLGNVSVSVRNVQHPKAWGVWNSNLKITPSLHFDSQTYQTGEKQTLSNGLEENYPDITVKRLMSFANLKWTNHTPIGSFALTAGFGGGIIKTDDGQGLNSVTTREIRRVDFAYTAFFAKRGFFLMGPRYYRGRNESFVFAFRLGLFWGDVKK